MFSPREIKKILKKLGLSDLKLEEISNVDKVIIQFSDGSRIEIDKPNVAKMNIANMIIYQIQTTLSNIREVRKEEISIKPQPKIDLLIQPSTQVEEIEISDEDIQLVIQETGCSRDEAIKALKETKGDIAEAIMLIKKRREST